MHRKLIEGQRLSGSSLRQAGTLKYRLSIDRSTDKDARTAAFGHEEEPARPRREQVGPRVSRPETELSQSGAEYQGEGGQNRAGESAAVPAKTVVIQTVRRRRKSGHGYGKRGTEIRLKGHFEYVCNERCFDDTTLGELKGIQFPGAFSKKSIGSLWNACRAACIFTSTDIDMRSKIKFSKDGAMCLDEEALQKVLRLAHDKYLDWIEFVRMTEGNRKHEKIDAFSFELTYNAEERAG
ncbi:unnamed protein product [Heligmosomoides polygyrus]|uniref:RusA family crossover junction endodeoxyribonuclease n=1 Tax=Heligmosomoides polygyrus TaxID=6339 RepID=A0A183FXW5_HELPZ|nr:unnamed protein product [Heligmosomoides polygyrus]